MLDLLVCLRRDILEHLAFRYLTSLISVQDGVQGAKKVVSDSPGLVDFAIVLVNSVFNLHDGQVKFYEEFK